MSAAVSASPSFWKRGDQEVSLARLYVMRAVSLLGIFGLFETVAPLVDHVPTERGMLKAMISGLWVMAFFSFRYPLKLLPFFLFEFVWKTLWLIFFGLPQWWSGVGSPRFSRGPVRYRRLPARLRARHSVGLCVASLHQGAVRTLALSADGSLRLDLRAASI